MSSATSPSVNPAAPHRPLPSVGFAPDVENNAVRPEFAAARSATSYGGRGDRTLLRTETTRSIAVSTRSGIGLAGPRLERTGSLGLQRVEARTALPADFRTLSIQINETKDGHVDNKGHAKGQLCALFRFLLSLCSSFSLPSSFVVLGNSLN